MAENGDPDMAEGSGLDGVEDLTEGEGFGGLASEARLDDAVEEPVTEPTELDEPLEDDLGIAEALQAWQAGGHAEEELDEGDQVGPVQFAQLDAQPPRVTERRDRLHNVEVGLTVELGRRELTVREILGLKEQDFIELDKLAGEAFQILVNGRPFAEGEIVVVTDLMAVRITRLITPKANEDARRG